MELEMADLITVRPSDLLIDIENPRLPTPNSTQREAQRALASLLDRKLVALAKDIVSNGLNPADMPIITPEDDSNGVVRYRVLEGNRRLTAIRALENPEWLDGIVDSKSLKEFKQLSAKYHESPLETITCLNVKDREAARHWIELRHTGENDGAGIVRWGSDEVDRFRARNGKADPVGKLLDFLEEKGKLSPELRRKLPVTNLKRLFSSPDFRDKVGVKFKKGEVFFLGTVDATCRALIHVIKDLTGTNPITVKDIYSSKDRSQYANSIPANVVVKPSTSGPSLLSTSEITKDVARDGKSRTASTARLARPRDRLIPPNLALKIDVPRIKEICIELKKLSLESYPNSVAVMLRVFLELSIDHYGAREQLEFEKLGQSGTLATRMKRSIEHLKAAKKLDKNQAAAAIGLTQEKLILAASVPTMNGYVHNKHLAPRPSDLRATWDNVQPFVLAIWSA